MTELKFDTTCIPYPRKGFYWMITLPYLVVFFVTAMYLWNVNRLIALLYSSFYIFSIFLHGYICSFSNCPYVGTMCPGAFGWSPVGKIARLFRKLNVKRSPGLTNVFFLFILVSLIGILALPLYWLHKLGRIFSLGYVVLVIGYFIAFIVTICPKCAGRLYCPTAKLSNWIHTTMFHHDILTFD